MARPPNPSDSSCSPADSTRSTAQKPATPGPKTVETLNLFRTLRRIARQFGMTALGGHVVSMTREPSDLLTVLWLWKWSEQTDGGHPRDAELRLPIVPLFETISDLERAAEILSTLLDNSMYRDWLAGLDDRQIVMIGYSDSTKDGGYLAACWNLQRAQADLHDVAAARGVKLTFFHGRGGSLGRGGGPAARAILSLPTPAFDGSLRLTEQGEILAERYDDPKVAYRHLEQVLWSVLVASAQASIADSRCLEPANGPLRRRLRSPLIGGWSITSRSAASFARSRRSPTSRRCKSPRARRAAWPAIGSKTCGRFPGSLPGLSVAV